MVVPQELVPPIGEVMIHLGKGRTWFVSTAVARAVLLKCDERRSSCLFDGANIINRKIARIAGDFVDVEVLCRSRLSGLMRPTYNRVNLLVPGSVRSNRTVAAKAREAYLIACLKFSRKI